MARNIGRASAVLSVALAIGTQVKSDQDEARKDAEAIRGREEIRAHYERVAEALAAEARSTAAGYTREYLTDPLEQMQQYADDLNRERKKQSLRVERLSEVSRQARDLIAEFTCRSRDDLDQP